MTATEPTPQERCARARELLTAGDAGAALGALRPVLGYPAAPEGALLREALGLLSAIGEELVGDHLRDLLAWARDHADDPEALYDAGYALYEQKLHDLAATLLDRANRLGPGSATVVTELAANLEALLEHGRAAAVLRASGLVETDSMCAYLYGYNALLSGDLEAARPVAASLRGLDDDSLAYMGSALWGMVARADAVRAVGQLGPSDLAGWHLAINGSVLTHLSPYGFDEPMRGRYAFVCDSLARVREGLGRLGLVLQAAGLARPRRVLALPDRSSRIVAAAAAQILGLPCEPWPAGGDDGPGVIVAYDLDQVGSGDALEHLRAHRPGQILFAHASCWTDPFPYAPDVTTYLYQSNVAPWDAQPTRDPGTGEVRPGEPDAAPEAEIAARIVAATAADESRSGREELANLAVAARVVGGEHAAGLFRNGGQRLRQRAGSPVRSNRFA